MTSILLRALAGALLLAGLLTSQAPAAPATVSAADEMARCTALGPKRAGNEAGRAMAARIVDRFRAAGLQTTTEDFRLPAFVPRRTEIAVVKPKAMNVPGDVFAYSGTGTVEAEVVDVGTGRASDYAGKDAKGKIVLVDRNEAFHRSAQLTEVVARGGAAMLYVSGSPKNLIQIGAVRFAQNTPAPIPTVTVGADDGKKIRALGAGLRMKVTVDADRVDTVGRNVVGVRRGTTYPDRYVLVAGHYDSWRPGAVDNCSSMGSLLRIVEETKDLAPAYSVIYAAWDAEEVGLVGSYNWAMRHQDLVPKIVMNENLEMTSAASYVGESRLDYSAVNLVFGTASPAMNALVYQAAGRNAFAPAPTTANGVRSVSGGIIPTDLQPFYAQGVQGFSTFSSTPWYHTSEDEADKIDLASLERVTSFLRDVLIGVQGVSPEALALREVPAVVVSAPKDAAPGAAVPVEIRVTDPAGGAVTGVAVKVLVNQRDHWAVAEGLATEVGQGRYRYTLPAGATDADQTEITATVDQPLYIAQGFARIDQRAGGLLPASRSCLSRRRLVLHPRAPGKGKDRLVRLTARTTAGRVRVTKRKAVVLDLRNTKAQTVRVTMTARTAEKRRFRQTRTYRTCVKKARLARTTAG